MNHQPDMDRQKHLCRQCCPSGVGAMLLVPPWRGHCRQPTHTRARTSNAHMAPFLRSSQDPEWSERRRRRRGEYTSCCLCMDQWTRRPPHTIQQMDNNSWSLPKLDAQNSLKNFYMSISRSISYLCHSPILLLFQSSKKPIIAEAWQQIVDARYPVTTGD